MVSDASQSADSPVEMTDAEIEARRRITALVFDVSDLAIGIVDHLKAAARQPSFDLQAEYRWTEERISELVGKLLVQEQSRRDT